MRSCPAAPHFVYMFRKQLSAVSDKTSDKTNYDIWVIGSKLLHLHYEARH